MERDTESPRPPRLPAAGLVLRASPEDDFTIGARRRWTASYGQSAEQALTACGLPPDTQRPASYTLRVTRLGLTYAVTGVFVAAGEGLLQLEMVAPVAKQPYVRDLFAAWIRAVSGQ